MSSRDKTTQHPGTAAAPGLAPARAMLDALDVHTRAEIERALRLTLFAPPSPAERRVRDLGPLARMLDAEADRLGLTAPAARWRAGRTLDEAVDWLARASAPHVPAEFYDAHRPAQAPNSRALTARFGGSWPQACRAVWGLLADGRYAGHSQPWESGVRGQQRIRYSDEECIAAVRACAMHFGRIPGVERYQQWKRARLAHARRVGAERPRLPAYESLRQRWGGWPGVLHAAQITDAELLTARAIASQRNPLLIGAPTTAEPAAAPNAPRRHARPQRSLRTRCAPRDSTAGSARPRFAPPSG